MKSIINNFYVPTFDKSHSDVSWSLDMLHGNSNTTDYSFISRLLNTLFQVIVHTASKETG